MSNCLNQRYTLNWSNLTKAHPLIFPMCI